MLNLMVDPQAMTHLDPSPNRKPSALWMWGFWIHVALAFAACFASLHAPAPADRILRGVAGALLLAGGFHQLRVVAYKRATRPLYATHGPDSYLTQRQAGWSAMVLGVVLIASGFVAW